MIGPLRRLRAWPLRPEGLGWLTGPSPIARVVGVCGACGGELVLEVNRRWASCPCGATAIPEPFLRAAAMVRRG